MEDKTKNWTRNSSETFYPKNCCFFLDSLRKISTIMMIFREKTHWTTEQKKKHQPKLIRWISCVWMYSKDLEKQEITKKKALEKVQTKLLCNICFVEGKYNRLTREMWYRWRWCVCVYKDFSKTLVQKPRTTSISKFFFVFLLLFFDILHFQIISNGSCSAASIFILLSTSIFAVKILYARKKIMWSNKEKCIKRSLIRKQVHHQNEWLSTTFFLARRFSIFSFMFWTRQGEKKTPKNYNNQQPKSSSNTQKRAKREEQK